ncbi:MAG TPA: hypothetical protein VLL74_05565 [Methanoregula sp.]|nr:hypothetical protein [Methanoregula sp.]
MTPDPVTITVLGAIDFTLLVISYLMYRRIRALSDRFERMAGSP